MATPAPILPSTVTASPTTACPSTATASPTTAWPSTAWPSTAMHLLQEHLPTGDARFAIWDARIPRQETPDFEAAMERTPISSCPPRYQENEEDLADDSASIITNRYENEPPSPGGTEFWRGMMMIQWREAVEPQMYPARTPWESEYPAAPQETLEYGRSGRVAGQPQPGYGNGEFSAMAEQRLAAEAQRSGSTSQQPEFALELGRSRNKTLSKQQQDDRCPTPFVHLPDAVEGNGNEGEAREGKGKGKAKLNWTMPATETPQFSSPSTPTLVQQRPNLHPTGAIGSFALHSRSTPNGSHNRSQSNERHAHGSPALHLPEPSAATASVQRQHPSRPPRPEHRQRSNNETAAPRALRTTHAAQPTRQYSDGRASGYQTYSRRPAPRANAPTVPEAQSRRQHEAKATKANWRDR